MIALTLSLTLLLLTVTMFGPAQEPVDVRAGAEVSHELTASDNATCVVTAGELVLDLSPVGGGDACTGAAPRSLRGPRRPCR